MTHNFMRVFQGKDLMGNFAIRKIALYVSEEKSYRPRLRIAFF